MFFPVFCSSFLFLGQLDVAFRQSCVNRSSCLLWYWPAVLWELLSLFFTEIPGDSVISLLSRAAGSSSCCSNGDEEDTACDPDKRILTCPTAPPCCLLEFHLQSDARVEETFCFCDCGLWCAIVYWTRSINMLLTALQNLSSCLR